MNIYTTHYFKLDGTKWSGNRILAKDWETAELIADLNKVQLTGKLVMEVDCDDDGSNIQWNTVKEYE